VDLTFLSSCSKLGANLGIIELLRLGAFQYLQDSVGLALLHRLNLCALLILLATWFNYDIRAASPAGTTDQENEMKDELLQIRRIIDGRVYAGESGAHGRWGRRDDNSYVPGRGLKPITDREAQRYLEETDGPVEAYFDVAEG